MLGYPQEYSSPLVADHHGVCKFPSDADEKYVCVKNVLMMIRSKLLSETGNSSLTNIINRPSQRGADERRSSNLEIARDLRDILGISDSTELEFNIKKTQRLKGSCQWLPHKQAFRSWIEPAGSDRPIFVLTGPPATGKSILASFVVDWIKDASLQKTCQHYFFVSADQTKRTISHCLRVIAFQLAMRYDTVREALFRLKDETNATFEQQSSKDVWEKLFQGIILRVSFPDDLCWVLDALDESDSPRDLCDMLLRSRFMTSIKIFITSRETRELLSTVYDFKDKVFHEALTPADTNCDIRDFVTTTVRANLPQDQEGQDYIIEQILNKADGSFLWARLKVDAIQDDWHTKEDISKAMGNVTEGMEHLYEEMLANVRQGGPRKLVIARAILTWTVCSYRPLRLSELQAALASDFGNFLSLKNTIGQICGQFIRVTDERVMLVHTTARDFLLNQSLGFIDKQESHQSLALACLRYLSDDSWRHVFALAPRDHMTDETRHFSHYGDRYPLLLYATHYWAYHVKNSVGISDELWKTLDTFFRSYVLVWIHGLAISSKLQTVVQIAQDLRYFTHRDARILAKTDELPISSKTRNPQWLRSWAIDLIRIVGKFGRALAQNPLSIYRQLPVFCPLKSQFNMVYGGKVSSGMTLAGISSSWWDDCIAQVNGIENETISRVLATDHLFVTLISTKGKATVWSNETCAELWNLDHNEYVTHMAVNKTGTILATAGVRTIRTWELSSGKQIHGFSNDSELRTMTLIFGHSDDRLIIGREDYSIQTYELSSGRIISTFWACPPRRIGMNGPRFMVISPDLTKVAVAERGKPVLIWDFERSQDQQPWRCVRQTDRLRDTLDEGAWTPSEHVCWHSEGTSILILYQSAGILHWNFIEDAQKEHFHIEGREMVLTKDGKFLLTSSFRGMLYIWALPRFNLIYKLFHEEIVRDLAFSPDGQRIYDSRGAICNVWEPEVLIRSGDPGWDDVSNNHESKSETSISSDPVMLKNGSPRSQITALVTDLEDQYYCCGRDDGSVTIHSAIDGSKVRKVYNHSSTVSIVALEWSHSSKYFVSCDDAGRIICKRLETKEAGKWAVFPVFDIRSKDLVQQFLFHSNERFLLISTESIDIVWSIHGKTKQETCRKSWPALTGRRWILCPDNPSRLLWIDPYKIDIFDWENLELQKPQSTNPMPADEPKSESRAGRLPLNSTLSSTAQIVRCIDATRNGRHLIIETVPASGHSYPLLPRNLKIQQISAFSSTSIESTALQRIALPDLSQQTSRLLGIFNDRILFIDPTFWVCTWELTGPVRAMKRHFFLPRDWITPASLQLVTCNAQGTVFCPRNGEVAIVRNGIKT